MTPKEKAEELHRKFWTGRDPIGENLRLTTSWSSATHCALIAINEMIKIAQDYEVAVNVEPQFGYLQYWLDVKQEIEKI